MFSGVFARIFVFCNVILNMYKQRTAVSVSAYCCPLFFHLLNYSKHEIFLFAGKSGPAFQKFPLIRWEEDEFSLGEKFAECDAECPADRFQCGDRRNGISMEDIWNRRLRKAGFFYQTVFGPTALGQKLSDAFYRVHVITAFVLRKWKNMLVFIFLILLK